MVSPSPELTELVPLEEEEPELLPEEELELLDPPEVLEEEELELLPLSEPPEVPPD